MTTVLDCTPTARFNTEDDITSLATFVAKVPVSPYNWKRVEISRLDGGKLTFSDLLLSKRHSIRCSGDFGSAYAFRILCPDEQLVLLVLQATQGACQQ